METRCAAGLLCYRISDCSLLLLHNARHGTWGVPKGYRDPSDVSDIACALRELGEEVGAVKPALIPSFRSELAYEVPASPGFPAHRKELCHFLGFWPEGAEPKLSEEHDAHVFAGAEDIARRVPYPELRALLLAGCQFAQAEAERLRA